MLRFPDTPLLFFATLVAGAAASAVGSGPVQPISSAWNDTACHEPSDPGCNTCCELALPPGDKETADGQWVSHEW